MSPKCAFAALSAALLVAGCRSTPPSSAGAVSPPRTRAERTRFAETSSYADVVAFIDSLVRLRAPIAVGSIGTTTEGRSIPYVIASRPLVRTPDEARATGRPIVYVQGNIHAGEIEGKEALLALVRDLVFDSRRNALDSIILVAVPIYNADGNEKLAAQAVNRSAQNGPEMVGQRPNASGFDLNRDYIKADAPETRASLRMFAEWRPDVFVDLHTTNGSYHGYALTYAPGLNPATDGLGGRIGPSAFARDSLLPELRRRMRARRNFEVFDYGNFASNDSVERGWFTYDSRPRFGTNYVGLRGTIAILSEAYSHDPLERRVASTYAFAREILSLVAERASSVRAVSSGTATALRDFAATPSTSLRVSLRSELTKSPAMGEVVAESLARTTDSVPTEPGVPRGIRRTGQYRPVRMPVVDRFDATRSRSLPWGYVFSASDTATLALLAWHGVAIEAPTGRCEVAGLGIFEADSASVAPRVFQGRREVRVEGRWRQSGAGTFGNRSRIIRTSQPLGLLAFYLLEPESDDGIVTWNVGDRLRASSPQAAIATKPPVFLPFPMRINAPPGPGCLLQPAVR